MSNIPAPSRFFSTLGLAVPFAKQQAEIFCERVYVWMGQDFFWVGPDLPNGVLHVATVTRHSPRGFHSGTTVVEYHI